LPVAAALLASPHLAGLRRLDLTGNPRIHWRKRQALQERFGEGVTFG
jgi:hypothetical protein